jgi:hypothetical protein
MIINFLADIGNSQLINVSVEILAFVFINHLGKIARVGF